MILEMGLVGRCIESLGVIVANKAGQGAFLLSDLFFSRIAPVCVCVCARSFNFRHL